MKIDFDGRVWDFSVLDMDVTQCEAVERYVGKGMGEWFNQLAAGGVKGVVALWWAIRAQNGEAPGPVIAPEAGFKPLLLLNAFNEAAAAEEEAEPEPEPDPTAPADGSPAPAPGADAAALRLG